MLHAGAGPAHRPLHGFPRILMAHRILRALIQHHHDVAAQRELHIHRGGRGEQMLIAIQVRLEPHAVFVNFPQPAQAEDLETA